MDKMKHLRTEIEKIRKNSSVVRFCYAIIDNETSLTMEEKDALKIIVCLFVYECKQHNIPANRILTEIKKVY